MAVAVRNRNVRMSVRTKSESVDATWRTPNKSWAHTRWQRFTLHPFSASEALALDKRYRAADWIAVGRVKPAVVPGQQLWRFDAAGVAIMILDVLHVEERGMRQRVICQEVTEVQS